MEQHTGTTKFKLIFLALLILGLLSSYSYFKSKLESKKVIIIATDEATSESFKMMDAVAEIINNEGYDFTLRVISTQGAIENSKLLDSRLVQLATLQADLKINRNVRLVANLYEEVFHLIFQPSISLASIEDVDGLKIAILTDNSGENYSYNQLVAHFGLDESKLNPISSTWKSATWLFNNGDIDAIFRVSEANHTGIKKFMTESNAQSRPITQSDAIVLNYPMYHKSKIPRGIFGGIPPNPKSDVITLGVDKLLVASVDTPSEVVNAIATILFTRKRELAEKTNVAGLAKVPEESSLIPWHQGLEDFVNKEKPNFIQKNAEFLALILSIIILMGSSIMQFFNRSKQQKLNAYNEQLLSIKINIEQTNNIKALKKLQNEHFALVNQIVGDAVQGRISSDGFEFFAFAWDSVSRIINEKEKSLMP
ncbi:MAG: TAXI family TRAP transporter solute-binding subunit [Cyclobacteriaceae bacterium]|nr:TAXI family TRAP transporter solute-binding subunit [Cyclobacteriaceae bacterium]